MAAPAGANVRPLIPDLMTRPAGFPAPRDRPMLLPLQSTPENWQPLLEKLQAQFPQLMQHLLSPWMLPQLILVPACYWLAHYLARWSRPQIDALLKTQAWPPTVLHLIGLALRQLKWILFVALLWLVAAFMRELTWASRSYLVLLAASLATAWVTINIVSPVIRNPSLSRIFAAVAWTIAALYILGILGETQALLDGIGVSIGDVRISLLLLMKGAIFLAVTLWLATVASNFADTRMRKSLDITPTVQVLFGKVIRAVLFAAAVMFSLSAIGIELTALTVFSGALGLGIGFGLQKVASNLMSGIIILLDKSVKPGDVIQRGDTFGWITALKARYVSVATRDGVEYLIPNEEFITSEVVNWSYTDRRVRLDFQFAVAPGSDPREIANAACKAVQALPRVVSDPPAACHVIAFGPNSLDFVIKFWIEDPEKGVTGIRSDAILAIWDGLKAAGMTLLSAKR